MLIKEAFFSYLKRNKVFYLLNEPMSNHTSFEIGGPADILIIPKTLNEIWDIVNAARNNKMPLFVIANGTNLLVSDNGIRGAVIKISKNLSKIQLIDEGIIAEAGTHLQDLVEISEQNSLSGLEFAMGIPGTIGGAIAMNAGTPQGEIKDLVANVTVINIKTGEVLTMSKENCKFAYRESIFQNEQLIILSAKLNLIKRNRNEIRNRMNEIIMRRKQTQPFDKRNAGCIFRNPLKSSAGRLIESLGLKGMTIGSAQISKRHGNFILNLGGAKFDDVYSLIKHVQKECKARYNIELTLELRVIDNQRLC